MPLSPETQSIIEDVERLSGRPVHVSEDTSLTSHATVITARGGSPAHFVRYKPGVGHVDYLVAYQLGFLVRMFSLPEEERFQVASSDAELEYAVDHFDADQLEPKLAHWLIPNLMTQLRTFPVGMRVDAWIREQYPALVPLQEESAKTQLRENESTLAPEIRERFPKKLVDCNASMNAAFAAFWSKILSDNRFVVPYRILGYDSISGELLDTIDKIPEHPDRDRELIALWGDRLGLTDCFHFDPHLLD